VVLDRPGTWRAEIRTQERVLRLALTVNATATAPTPGTAAPRAPSPTPLAALGVSPICTRAPACPLHSVSLADIVGAGKPAAVMFATPARCQTQYCGPVLDELLKVMGPYQDRITFVHVEIYKASTGTDLVPTVDAWHLTSEPWLFGVDATGTIVSRIDGAFGGGEIKAVLDPLAA
jgi:hypothetical protein